MLISTVGASRRSPSVAAFGWCSSSVSAASSSARRNASAWPTRTRAEGPGGVVDQVGQRLRHRRPRDRPDELVHLDRRPAGVERAAYGPGREPVDGRAAARLDVGDQLQPPGQLRLQRAGRDRGQVGLEQHVVDRRRAAAPARPVVAPSRRRRRAASGRTTPARRAPASPERRSPRRPPTRPGRRGCAGRRGRSHSTRCDQRRHAGPGGQHRRPARAPPARRASSARVSTWWHAGQLGGERVPGLARGVAGADQPGQPRALQPGAAPAPAQRSAVGRARPGVEGVGRDPDAGCRRVRPRSTAARRPRRPRPAGRRSARRRAARRRWPAGRGRRARRCAAPRAAAAPHWSSSSSTRRTASKAAPAAARSTMRLAALGRWPARAARRPASAVVWPPRSASPTSPGSTTAPPLRGHQQPVGEQLLGRAWRRPRAARCAGRRRWSPRRPASRTCSSSARAGGESAVEPGGDLVGGQRVGRDRPQAADPGRAGRQRLGHGRSAAARPAGSPRPGPGRAAGRARRAPTPASPWTTSTSVVGAGLADDDEGIKDTELEPVQLVERAQDRGPGGRPRGQLAGVVRGRSGEIGALVEQTGQPVVRPAAQLVGERAVRRRGHPSHATGPGAGGAAVSTASGPAWSFRGGDWFGIFGPQRDRRTAAVREGPGRRGCGSWSTTAPASTRPSTP